VILLGFSASGCVGRRPSAATERVPPPPEGTLRVVTLNAWGIPFRDHHELLLEALAPALAALSPDVVLLQEVWFEDDAARVADAFADLGLPHQEHRASDAILAYDSSGLLIASRWPLSDVRFAPFGAGRLPVRPWHVDWFSGKGVLDAQVDTPWGPLRFGTVHMQADYGTSVYTDVRLAQTAELVAALRGRAIDVLAGDFNSHPHELEHRVVREALGLESVAQRGVDDVLVAPGLTAMQAWTLDAPGADVQGEKLALSDHPLLVADLAVTPSPPGRAREGTIGAALSGDLDGWWKARERWAWLARSVGWLAAAAALGLVLASARHRRRHGRAPRHRLVRAVLLLLAMVAIVGAYRLAAVGAAQDHWRETARVILLERR
jgi:endonuclease/exonuclease/phosphatase family metal-dependent hydrolase